MKIAFRQLCVTLCGRFGPDEGGVAGYVDRIGTKYTAKWGVQMAVMNFQTRPGKMFQALGAGGISPRIPGRRDSMAEFQELIKNFDRIRDYMRQFYVYGFKVRNDFQDKSPRTYDNERRRIESWLADYTRSDYTLSLIHI